MRLRRAMRLGRAFAMIVTDRRRVLAGLSAALCAAAAPQALLAQQPEASPPQPRFGFEEVVRRAREISIAPYEAGPSLPEALTRLDFDAWREIRFRPERSLLAQTNSGFRLQMFHPGFLFTRPVTVN